MHGASYRKEMLKLDQWGYTRCPEIGASANTQASWSQSSCKVEEGLEQLTHQQVRSPAGLSPRVENQAEGNKEVRMGKRGLPLDGCDHEQSEATFYCCCPSQW